MLTATGLGMLAVVAATALSGWALWRWWLSARGAAPSALWALLLLRATLLAALLLAVANPAVRRSARVARQSEVLILLDASASMALPGTGTTTRWQEAQTALQHIRTPQSGAAARVSTRVFSAGMLADQTSAAPVGDTTDLALALQQLSAVRSPASIVVVSDGAQTQGDAARAANRLRQRGVTVHAVGVGPTDPPPDGAILSVQAPLRVPERTAFTISVNVSVPATSSRRELLVSRADEVVRRVPVAPDEPPTSVKASLPGLPAGTHLFTVSLPAVPGEATATNNQRSFFVEVVRDQLKLSVVAGSPSQEFANLRRVLADLPRTNLRSWASLSAGRYLVQTAGTSRPGTLSWSTVLSGCHVLVLADVEQRDTDAAAIRRFVREGGALALLGGRRGLSSGDWRDLAAVSGGPYQDVPTGTGTPDAATRLGGELLQAIGRSAWQAAPHLAGTNAISAVNPDAEVVLRTRDGKPLLATRPYGLGRCLALATDGTYRWVLSPDADEDSRRLHRLFWTQLVAWLAQPRDDSQVVLMLDPPVVASGQPARALVQVSRGHDPVAGAQVTIRASGAGAGVSLQATPTTVPGRYQASLSQLAPGKHEVVAEAQAGQLLGTARGTLVVEPGGAEVSELTVQEGALKRIAAAGGGQYVGLDGLQQLLESALAGTETRELTRVTWPFRSLWAFLVVLTLCAADWLLRRRHGL